MFKYLDKYYLPISSVGGSHVLNTKYSSRIRVVRHEANESEELWRDALLLKLVVHQLGDVLRQNLHESLGCQLPHAVVLDWSSR